MAVINSDRNFPVFRLGMIHIVIEKENPINRRCDCYFFQDFSVILSSKGVPFKVIYTIIAYTKLRNDMSLINDNDYTCVDRT